MNVIVANNEKEKLSNLDVDIIKSINGVYEATEIVDMFKNFFFNRMILDVSAIKNYENISSFQVLVNGIDADKIIFFLPEGSSVCTASFLSQLVSLGIYNFTTNLDGVMYLLKKPNTYDDVSSLQKMNDTGAVVVQNNVNNNNTITVSKNVSSGVKVLGFKNATENAGATSLIYMLKKELSKTYGDKVIALEVDKIDFQYFNDSSMKSIKSDSLVSEIKNNSDKSIILVDLNNFSDETFFDGVIYLLEPSTIKVNKLVKNKREFLRKLGKKVVVLNKCFFSSKDVSDFDKEAGIESFFVIPPINDRENNEVIVKFCEKLGLLQQENNTESSTNGGIFSIFRR